MGTAERSQQILGNMVDTPGNKVYSRDMTNTQTSMLAGIALIDLNGAVALSNHTNPATNEIHHSTARGIVNNYPTAFEIYLGPDCQFIRRVD